MIFHITKPLHLYRSLLRETTYLFDSKARLFLHDYITSSFRTKIPKAKKRPQHAQQQDAERLPTLGERHQLKCGRKFLSTLQRANQGHLLPLSNVLRMTYGRKGPRRREAMSQIMLPESAADVEVTAGNEKSSAGSLDLKKFEKGWKAPPKYTALLRSQASLQRWLNHNASLRLKCHIAEKNAWGRPMPESRIRNANRKWYAYNAQFLLPPVNEEEWEEIRVKAQGEGLVVPKRRTAATVPVFATSADTSAQRTDPELESKLLEGPTDYETFRQRGARGRPHNMTRRFLKRFYTRVILQHTPKAISAGDGKTTTFVYDHGLKRFPQILQTANDGQAAAMFG